MSSHEKLIIIPTGSAEPIITPMRHDQYLNHLLKHLLQYADDSSFWTLFGGYIKEFIILAHLNLDPVIPILEKLYSPNKAAPPRDPVSMLRSFVLMTLRKEKGVTNWVKQTRDVELMAILAGFVPRDTPGVGTYYDFMDRILDGPWQKPCCRQVKRSERRARKHLRSLAGEKKTREEENKARCQTQSEELAQRLLQEADRPRVEDFRKTLEDLLIQAGLAPSIEGGFLTDLQNLVAGGDGSILESAASGQGKPTCTCRSQGIYTCDHPREYTSATAQWCYDHHNDTYKFGDRYYILVVHQNGHDFPLFTFMPGGNRSDHTLSLETFDRFLKAVRENGLKLHVGYFVGDAHHDANAHHRYFLEKGVTPVIPLSESSKKVVPHPLEDRGVEVDSDGTPLCPAGVRMRHHGFNKARRVHVYSCPVKRGTHRDGKFLYAAHLEECPRKEDCAPNSTLGPLVYVKPETDLRLFPVLSRESARYKELMNHRSGTERTNALIDAYNLEGVHRSAEYNFIRLTLAGIASHAVIRHLEELKYNSLQFLFDKALHKVLRAAGAGVSENEFLHRVLERAFPGKEYGKTG